MLSPIAAGLAIDDTLSKRLSEPNDWLQSYVKLRPSEKLVEKIHFRLLDGKGGTMTREEVLFHPVNHGTYHRGAIGRALDLAGGLRPADTYTVFIHATEPGRKGKSDFLPARKTIASRFSETTAN